MRNKGRQNDSKGRDLKQFEFEPIMKFKEMPVAEAEKILKMSILICLKKKLRIYYLFYIHLLR